MGRSCSSILTDIYLTMYEVCGTYYSEWKKINKTFRYVDDNILIGSNGVEKNNFKYYPNSLNLKKLKKEC